MVLSWRFNKFVDELCWARLSFVVTPGRLQRSSKAYALLTPLPDFQTQLTDECQLQTLLRLQQRPPLKRLLSHEANLKLQVAPAAEAGLQPSTQGAMFPNLLRPAFEAAPSQSAPRPPLPRVLWRRPRAGRPGPPEPQPKCLRSSVFCSCLCRCWHRLLHVRKWPLVRKWLALTWAPRTLPWLLWRIGMDGLN